MRVEHVYRTWLRAIAAGREAAGRIDRLGSSPARERSLAEWVATAAEAEETMARTVGGDAESARLKLVVALHAITTGAAGDPADPAWQLVLSAFGDLDGGARRTGVGMPSTNQEVCLEH